MSKTLPPPHYDAPGHPDYPWSTEIDGTHPPQMRHVSRDVALAYAADRLAALPPGAEAVIDQWVTDTSTGLDLNGLPGVWQFDSAHVFDAGRLAELDENGDIPADVRRESDL